MIGSGCSRRRDRVGAHSLRFFHGRASVQQGSGKLMVLRGGLEVGGSKCTYLLEEEKTSCWLAR